jgi:hypothetical protein
MTSVESHLKEYSVAFRNPLIVTPGITKALYVSSVPACPRYQSSEKLKSSLHPEKTWSTHLVTAAIRGLIRTQFVTVRER